MGNHRDAAIAFRKFIDAFPSHEMVRQSAFMLAKCLEADGDLQSALAVHQRADWSFNDEFAAEAVITQSRLLDSLGKKQAAIITLEEAIQDPTVNRSQMVQMTYQLAWQYLTAAQYADAEKTFRTIHDQYPESLFWSDATFRLAIVESEQKKRPDALKSLERLFACARDSEVHPQSFLLKAKLLAEDGRWHESLAVIEQLVNQYCHLEISSEAEYWLAEANYRIDNFEAAERLFAELARRPETALNPEWQALVPLRRAQLMAIQANWRAAADQASFVLDSFPDFRQAYEAEYVLGRCLAVQARFAEARMHYDNVVASARKTETAAMAQWMIGESYFHQKSYDEAIRAYLKVDILYDNRRWQAAALLQAAKCFELTDELHDAVDLYTRLISDFSDTPFAAQAIDRQNALKANNAKGNQTAATTNGSKLK
jgi:TolA-binding protein